MGVIDQSVARVLRTKFQLGLFENPWVDEGAAAGAFDTPADRALARRIAQQSIVLLKNEDDLLPLSKTLKSVAVIGPNAGVSRNLVGDYTYICHVETLIEARDKDNAFGAAIAKDIEIVEDFVPIVSLVLEVIRAAVDAHHRATRAGLRRQQRPARRV
ncbi:MAG: glycoside hydrolase family 3 C-terminal domain-containing protein [Anaerolineae bacterium]|nr:glycoside hydrolase family 3 C-terminal domain-containing protein [Anaerolineae bacterium]